MSRERDIAYGRHSLIPECCIMFFVDEWDNNNVWDSAENWYKKAVQESNFGYIPCPSCLGSRNKVKLRICTTDCGKECWKEYR